VDPAHGEALAVIVVGQWTGQEAGALRQALRMTIPEFAERLGVAVRTVAKWEACGPAIVPVPVLQAVLDTVLARASDEAKSRFGILVAANGDGVRYEDPELKSSPNSAGPRSPLLPRFLNVLIPKRLAGCGRSSWST
jgi:hypothetical protein